MNKTYRVTVKFFALQSEEVFVEAEDEAHAREKIVNGETDSNYENGDVIESIEELSGAREQRDIFEELEKPLAPD